MLRFFKKLLSPFTKLSSKLGNGLRALFGRTIDETALEEMEKLFFEADLGTALSLELTEKTRRFLKKHEKASAEELLRYLKAELLPIFPKIEQSKLQSPHVILLVGVNGSGKTTTLAKLAFRYRKEGRSVLIAAGDTFRAAALEQLETWAKRIGVDLIRSQTHSDPAAVAFDALAAAKARGTEVVLIDTAGRLQTKTDLMQELAKVRKSCEKQLGTPPHETLLVVDATMGQNALDQAKIFHGFTPLSGIVLTKLDGSAKGGIAACIQKELKVPILWVGLGEKEEDLEPFDAEEYLNALLNIHK